MNWLWPPKTGITFFDVWSVAHFAAFLVVGMNAEVLRHHVKLSLLGAWLGGLLLGLLWELAEAKLETVSKVIKHPEGPLNRWISDPIVDSAGMGVGLLLATFQ
jgi:hypothetical protein